MECEALRVDATVGWYVRHPCVVGPLVDPYAAARAFERGLALTDLDRGARPYLRDHSWYSCASFFSFSSGLPSSRRWKEGTAGALAPPPAFLYRCGLSFSFAFSNSGLRTHGGEHGQHLVVGLGFVFGSGNGALPPSFTHSL